VSEGHRRDLVGTDHLFGAERACPHRGCEWRSLALSYRSVRSRPHSLTLSLSHALAPSRPHAPTRSRFNASVLKLHGSPETVGRTSGDRGLTGPQNYKKKPIQMYNPHKAPLLDHYR
jgi:hypothetical protein